MAPKKIESIKKAVKRVAEKAVPVSSSETKRDILVGLLREKLLTNEQLKHGGPIARGKHAQEQAAYQPIVDDINVLSLELGLPKVSIGSLRR